MAEPLAAAEEELTRRTGLTAEQRSERASKAGRQSNAISSYVKRITRNAPDLTPADLEALRQIVGPAAAPDVYAEGVRAGARMALDRIVRLASESV